MNIGILYYSQTGRNEKLAKLVGKKLGIEPVKIAEAKERKMMTVAWDLTFARKPKVMPDPDVMDKYDVIILFAPVWMGAAATPVRAYLHHIKKTKKDYMYISLSGGADESNPNLRYSIVHRTNHDPKLLLDMHVAKAIDGKPTREETQRYQVTDSEFAMFADRATKKIHSSLKIVY